MQIILRLLVLSLLLANGLAGFGQGKLVLRGVVRDSVTQAPLESATVALRDSVGRRVIATRRSAGNGFIFRGLTPGTYQLVTSYLGYGPDTTLVVLRPSDSVLNRTIVLGQSSRALMQVVVTAHIPPAIVRNDTIAFNAGAYPTRPNATVEDLLRKLPGVEVDKDGNVTMQGRKIDKIYLDGKEFFLNDPRLATQNLPSDIVDQIETFDSQTERGRRTGVRETTGTKSINIKLKKNRRSGFFGKAYAGAGSGGASNPSSPLSAYSGGGTITSLSSSWTFASANLNDINNQFTGQENRNGPGGGGIQRFNNLEFNYSNNKENGRRRFPGLAGGIKAGIPPNPFVITVNAGTEGNHTILDQKSTTQTALTDSSLLSIRNSHSVSNTQATHGNVFLQYNIDTFSQLSLHSAVSGTNSSSNESDTTAISTLKPTTTYGDNQGRTVNASHTHELTVSNELNYLLRGHRQGRTLFVSVNQSDDHQNQPQNTYSLVHNFDSSGALLSQTLINQSILQTSDNKTYGGTIAYTEPLKPGHVLDLSYGINHSISASDRASNDYDSATGHYDRPDSGTSNHFTTYNTIQRLGVGYNATEGKFQYQVGVSLQLSALHNLNRSVDSTLTLRQTNWFPRASLIYSSGHGSSFFFFYNAITTSPTVQQLQPVSDPTNPFLIKLGNPDLLQQLTHSVNIDFNSLNTHNFHNLQVGLQGNYSQHYISTATTILSGGIQQIQYINVNGVWSTTGNITYGLPLGDQRKGNTSLGLNGSYGRNVSDINTSADVTTTLGWGANWKLNLHPVDRLFIEAHAAISNTVNRYSLNPEQNVDTWLQSYSLDISYTLPGAITVSSLYNLKITGAQASLPAQDVSLWNAAVYKDLGRRHDVQVRFSAFGLLNTTQTITQTTGANFVSTNQSNLPGRILLLSMVYHFRKFPGA